MVVLATNGITSFQSVMQLVGLLLICIFVFVVAYFTTKWIAKWNLSQVHNKNIQVIETYRISQNKYIQIIKIANQYIAIGIGKDTIEYLAELDNHDLILPEKENNPKQFKEIFAQLRAGKNSKIEKNNKT